jgi:hypothetical protein
MSQPGATPSQVLTKALRDEVIGRPVVDNYAHLEPADHLATLEGQLATNEVLYVSIDGRFALSVATEATLTRLRDEVSRTDEMKPPERIRAFALNPAEHLFAQWILNSSGYYLLDTHISDQPHVYTALTESTGPEEALAAMGRVVSGLPQGPTGYFVARLERRADVYVVLDWRPVHVDGWRYTTATVPDFPPLVTISFLE